MARAPTPPLGLKLNLEKTNLRNFGSKQLAARLMRGADGRWKPVTQGANLGYIVFLNRTDAELDALPDKFAIEINSTQRTAGFAAVI